MLSLKMNNKNSFILSFSTAIYKDSKQVQKISPVFVILLHFFLFPITPSFQNMKQPHLQK